MAATKSSVSASREGETVWLDCTLRDGGYYNAWDFPHKIVQQYLDAMSDCGATHVELGFRSTEKAGYRGPTAYTTNSFLASLTIPPGLQVGAMVNTHELRGTSEQTMAVLDQLFPEKAPGFISFVRLATHPEEVDTALRGATWLKSKGYIVGLNLMQISETSGESLKSIAKSVDSEVVDVLYMADSLGNLSPNETGEIVRTIASNWGGDIGIHAHDNGGLALANSLAAMDSGARWVDSTITGMGRGAGNTASEILLGHLATSRGDSPRTEKLEALISEFFEPLRRKGRWGPNIHYVRAAAKGIHPTFVQEMLGNSGYSSLEISAAIDALGTAPSRKYSHESLEAAESWILGADSPRSDWDQSVLFGGSRVLFVGSGSSVELHKAALQELARDPSITVVGANFPSGLNPKLFDAHVACHPLRIISDSSFYQAASQLLIVPQNLVPGEVAKDLVSANRLLNIGLTIAPGPSSAEPGLIVLPKPHVLPFGLLLLLSGGAREILLAGFDGYQESDPRRAVEQTMLHDILGQNPNRDVRAITPTEFDLPQTSVYGLVS